MVRRATWSWLFAEPTCSYRPKGCGLMDVPAPVCTLPGPPSVPVHLSVCLLSWEQPPRGMHCPVPALAQLLVRPAQAGRSLQSIPWPVRPEEDSLDRTIRTHGWGRRGQPQKEAHPSTLTVPKHPPHSRPHFRRHIKCPRLSLMLISPGADAASLQTQAPTPNNTKPRIAHDAPRAKLPPKRVAAQLQSRFKNTLNMHTQTHTAHEDACPARGR